MQGLVEEHGEWFIDFDIRFTESEILKEDFDLQTEETAYYSEPADLPKLNKNDVVTILIASNVVSLFINGAYICQSTLMAVGPITTVHPYVMFKSDEEVEKVTYLGFYSQYRNPTLYEPLRVYTNELESLGEEAK